MLRSVHDQERSTFVVKNSGLYPSVVAESGDVPAVGLAGARLLTETSGVTGLGNELSQALSTWRRPVPVGPFAAAVREGGLRACCLRPDGLATCRGLGRPRRGRRGRARRTVRHRVWALAGADAPTAGVSANRPLVIDVDATLVNVHSDKEGAAPTFKKGFGYHPLTAWFDHGPDGGGECAALVLRPGNAGSNTAADHVEIIGRALDQAGLGPRPGRKVLVRIDGAGGTKETT